MMIFNNYYEKRVIFVLFCKNINANYIKNKKINISHL